MDISVSKFSNLLSKLCCDVELPPELAGTGCTGGFAEAGGAALVGGFVPDDELPPCPRILSAIVFISLMFCCTAPLEVTALSRRVTISFKLAKPASRLFVTCLLY